MTHYLLQFKSDSQFSVYNKRLCEAFGKAGDNLPAGHVTGFETNRTKISIHLPESTDEANQILGTAFKDTIFGEQERHSDTVAGEPTTVISYTIQL
jgi:hypothetical protein